MVMWKKICKPFIVCGRLLEVHYTMKFTRIEYYEYVIQDI